jgi:hypothetical protein
MADAVDTLRNHVEQECRAWAREYVLGRQAFLQSRKIQASERLKKSLEFEVNSAVGNALRTTVQVGFEDYGRYIDMKRLNPPKGGGDYIAALAEWIVQRGFLARWTPKFMKARGLKTVPQDIVNQMAWGIAVKRTRKYKRRAWYSKSKAAAIDDLYNRVASSLPDIVAQEVAGAFK